MECMVTILFVNQPLTHGANNMNSNNYYPSPIYTCNKEIKNFIEELIFDHQYKSYDHFEKDDKRKLSSMLSRTAGKMDELEFMATTDSNSLITLFRKSILSSNILEKNNFIEKMENAFISYYDETMEDLFNYYFYLIIENAA